MNIDPSWKLTRGSFFNVEYWTGVIFQRWILRPKVVEFIPGVIFQQLDNFFLTPDDVNKLKIDPVEYWPHLKVWTFFLAGKLFYGIYQYHFIYISVSIFSLFKNNRNKHTVSPRVYMYILIRARFQLSSSMTTLFLKILSKIHGIHK